MDKENFVLEGYELDRREIESEVGRPITDEEWMNFVDEIGGSLDYYFTHNYNLLVKDLTNGVSIGQEG